MSEIHVDYMLSCNVTSYVYCSVNLILYKHLCSTASTKKVVWHVCTAIKLGKATLSKACPPATMWRCSDAEEH